MSADATPADVPVSGVYLTLRAFDQTFALPIEFARCVFKIEAFTRVPSGPPYLVGLSHLRGGIVGIVCLARRLYPDSPALGVGALAIAIEVRAETFALAVQEIGDLINVRSEDVSPTRRHADLQHSTMMAGVIRFGAALLPVLDPFSIFEICRVAEAA